MIGRAAATLALALPLLAGCGDIEGRAAGGTTLTVFAAASLTGTFTDLGTVYERDHPGVDVRLSFAGSSTLARQISQGAPADVFASADRAVMRRVAAETAAGPHVFASNRLVIAVPEDGPARVGSVGDLARPGRTVVMCAAPVPCGSAARRALDAAGVRVRPASLERDVKAVLTKVRMGEADAGLVYRTDARAASGDVRAIEFPAAARAVNRYPIATLKSSRHPDHAAGFVRLVRSAEGRAVLSRAGFDI